VQRPASFYGYPKLFVKISHTWSISKQPYPYVDAQQFVKRLYEKFGPQRLMWAKTSAGF